MTISPETLTATILGDPNVSKENKKAIFLKDAIVAIFDGLIIFRGDLNMAEAIPRLTTIAMGLGLPVAVIEKGAFQNYNKKKYKIGKHIGPGNFMKNSWNTEEGFDFGLKEKYDCYGIEKSIEETKKATTTHINRSHLESGTSSSQAISHNSRYSIDDYEDDDWSRMHGHHGWYS